MKTKFLQIKQCHTLLEANEFLRAIKNRFKSIETVYTPSGLVYTVIFSVDD